MFILTIVAICGIIYGVSLLTMYIYHKNKIDKLNTK